MYGNYTAYINGCSHPKLMPKHESRWFYHDGKSNKGFLITEIPKFSVSILKERILPYILVYKMI